MAHLYAFLASESPLAVLLKLGPGSQTCTIGWDRATDSFLLGQWLKKRIDRRDADLSPDGKHFVYWVNDHSWSRPNHVYRAISLAPWLKAITFWGAAAREYGPGTALFFRAEDGRLRLLGSPCPPEWDELGIEVVPELPDTSPWKDMRETDARFFVQLQRNGWRATTAWEPSPPFDEDSKRASHRIVFEKSLPFGWVLRQTHLLGRGSNDVENRGTTWEAFALVSPAGELDDRSAWEWADWDPQRSRVVWTDDSVLCAAACASSGLGDAQVLFDARTLAFERRLAPY